MTVGKKESTFEVAYRICSSVPLAHHHGQRPCVLGWASAASRRKRDLGPAAVDAVPEVVGFKPQGPAEGRRYATDLVLR